MFEFFLKLHTFGFTFHAYLKAFNKLCFRCFYHNTTDKKKKERNTMLLMKVICTDTRENIRIFFATASILT